MSTLIDELAQRVFGLLGKFGSPSPKLSVLRTLLQTVYLASLKTEEGRFVRPSVTFANPKAPEMYPPLLRRADYPSFTKVTPHEALTVDTLVKLSRAINEWSGSIAVFGTERDKLFAWGVIDQLVQQNTRLNFETESGFENPGILTIKVDGVGDLTAYRQTVFLGALRGHRLVVRENDALRSQAVQSRIKPALELASFGIARSLEQPGKEKLFLGLLQREWVRTVARLCIGLRRLGCGGSLLISATPNYDSLEILHKFNYKRLGDSMTLHVLDQNFVTKIKKKTYEPRFDIDIPTTLVSELLLAEADALDRESEVTGAVKIVTSLAAADGLVLLSPTLHVIGFGVKIGSGPKIRKVFDGSALHLKTSKHKTIDCSGFGTRHGSMLRYCQIDKSAIGIVVSQDGHVRVITSSGRHVALWNDVKLLRHDNYSTALARRELEWRNRQNQRRTRRKSRLGYTSTPKTIKDLLGPSD